MAEARQQLIKKRGQIKGALTRFSSFLDKCLTNVNIDVIQRLELRLASETDLLVRFNTVQDELETEEGPTDIDNEERELFETDYYNVIAKAKGVIRSFYSEIEVALSVENTSIAGRGTPSQTNHQASSNVRFPVLELPKFYGEYEKWGQFRDMFMSMVHNDNSLDNIKKFYYLLSCVKGDAAKVFECIEVTNENYDTAWSLLKSRYQNKSIIIKNHVGALFELPVVERDVHLNLRKLTDAIQKHIRSLRTLGEPVDSWDTVLFYLITQKLDPATQREWESRWISHSASSNVQLKFSDLITFLEQRCQLLESLNRQKSEVKITRVPESKHIKNQNFYKKYSEKHFAGYSGSGNKVLCLFCKEPTHHIYDCNHLKALPVASRVAEIKKLRLCTNCLRDNHQTSFCRAQGCKKCNKKHNTMLHYESQDSDVPRQDSTGNLSNSVQISNELLHDSGKQTLALASTNKNIVTNSFKTRDSQIILSTAIVLIKDFSNTWHECRVILDNGSQPNFVSKRLYEKLGLPPVNLHIPIVGVGSSVTGVNKTIRTSIKSKYTNFSAELTFLVLNKITENLPSRSFSLATLNIPTDIVLSDPNFNVSQEIDLLLGAGLFYDLMQAGQIKLGSGLPILQETLLGWIVSGTMPSLNHNDQLFCNISLNKSLEQCIEKFWQIEEVTSNKNQSREEQDCEDIFVKTLNRDHEGRFVVSLPLRENTGTLGYSLGNAVKRMTAMERKFSKNPDFKMKYIQFMTEYEHLGHMSKIESVEITNKAMQDIFYLPHHGVINDSSLTTKLRVVFDGSCKSSTGISLNDKLMVGPTIQNDLLSILIRFRQHMFVITADIKQMYRQVNVAEHQRDLQRIVWRSSPGEEIQHYKLNTVTYGTSCASFLAIRSLQQIALENQNAYPEACRVISNDFYVDDLLSGYDTILGASKLKHDLTGLLSKYGFELRKWISNKVEILDKDQGNSTDQYYITDDEVRKALGLLWHAKQDMLVYTVDMSNSFGKNITKRSILSLVSKLFDPLGLLSAVTVRAKLLMQSLWQLKIGWDDVLPKHVLLCWEQFSKQLHAINHIHIPRQVLINNHTRLELHGFCDASQKAYAACIYIKSFNKNNQALVRLLCSKTRVAPIKTITLPRLELCGAALLAQLFDKVQKSLNLDIDSTYCWTDSTIVLAWLSASPNAWKIFVANRVSEIQGLTQNCLWRHVESASNPADLASRGVDPDSLEANSLWWEGPEWLSRETALWPKAVTISDDVPEKRKTQVVYTNTGRDFNIFERFSNLFKLQRVIAICIRFYKKLKHRTKVTGKLTLEELNYSLILLTRLAQAESFSSDIDCIAKSQVLPKKSKLKSLDPFLDSDNLLRVGGRLTNSGLSYENKHPLILEPKHPLTRLIILDEHHRHLHAGPQMILNSIRQRFWPLSGRATVRSVLRRCITCFRVNPTNVVRKMADLPVDRVTQNRPFHVVGVDFAGPFNIKDGKLRNRAIIKAYLCVFICFTTKAVHLEVVSDLSTQAFLKSLKRFIARRGICKRIYSDNGTNLVGTSNKLKHLYKNLNTFVNDHEVLDFFLKNNIEWKFIPPRSPHQGGLWEASVKRAKYHATRIIGRLTLTFEDLSTIFAQIEAIMNSRPLTPLSGDPRDFSALTPGHFLIGQPLSDIPQADITDLPQNRLNQFEILQQASQLFWKRWSNDYLHHLQQRSRWNSSSPEEIKEYTVVLIVDENHPPLYWKLGRILKLHRGSDGIVRTVTLRTSTGETTRAVQKLCVLPMEDQL